MCALSLHGGPVGANEAATEVVDAAVAIHKTLGPGLLESVYAAALEIELTERRLRFEREVVVNATYHGKSLGAGYRADFVVENVLLVEIKSVRGIEPVHLAQTLSYLRLGRWRLGLLLNFNASLMKSGIKRIVNQLE